MQYAIVDSNVITNVAVADAPLAESWQPLPEGVGIGWWRSAAGESWKPPAVTPAAYPRFEGNAKLDLFTPAEQLAVVAATQSDPRIKLLYDRLLGAAYWTYEDPETEYGLSVLQDAGLITVERKAEIVAAMQPR